jgi:hypothetical protein
LILLLNSPFFLKAERAKNTRKKDSSSPSSETLAMEMDKERVELGRA